MGEINSFLMCTWENNSIGKQRINLQLTLEMVAFEIWLSGQPLLIEGGPFNSIRSPSTS